MGCLCRNGYPLAASAITYGLLLVTHGLHQLQKQPIGDQFQWYSEQSRQTGTYLAVPSAVCSLVCAGISCNTKWTRLAVLRASLQLLLAIKHQTPHKLMAGPLARCNRSQQMQSHHRWPSNVTSVRRSSETGRACCVTGGRCTKGDVQTTRVLKFSQGRLSPPLCALWGW